MTNFPPYVHAEAERFNNMRDQKISLLAAAHLIDTLAEALTEEGILAVPDEITAEFATRVVADPNDREQRAILEALEDVAELERQYSQARDALIRIAMATPAPRDAILAASGLKSRSRLYQIEMEGGPWQDDPGPAVITTDGPVADGSWRLAEMLAEAQTAAGEPVSPAVLTAEELRAALNNPNGEPRVVLAPIDVELAEQLLEDYMPSRPLNRRRVGGLADEITRTNGSGDPFGFEQVAVAAGGRAFKGQHLLHAIVTAGQPIDLVAVLLNAPPVLPPSLRQEQA